VYVSFVNRGFWSDHVTKHHGYCDQVTSLVFMSLHTRDAQPAFECLRRRCQSADDDAAIRLPQYYLADHFDNLDKFT